jgi:molybdenum cofactor guanylyltransferase
MGGVPKGLLLTESGQSVVDHLVAVARTVSSRIVLVGQSDSYPLDLPRLPDAARGLGPLAGLASLLEYAGEGHAVAIACDMPFVTSALLGRLVDSDSSAAAVAPKLGGRWEPFFARFLAPRSLPVVRARLERGELALQGLMDELQADELELSASESSRLKDWDSPEDMA